MPMNRSEARVIDPILSNVALGYSNPAFVGMALFPRVTVPTSGAKVIKFGKESFLKYNLRRAPGANVVDVQFGYSADPIALLQDALNGKVPREFLRDSAQVPGIQMGTTAVREAMMIALRSLELDHAELAQNAAGYDANHKVTLGTAWTNPAADIKADVDAGKDAIRASTGAVPNVLLIPYTAFQGAANNTKVKEQFKYTSNESITSDMLARFLGVDRVVVGQGNYAADETSDFTDIWTKAVLAYVPTVATSMGMPSYGYTYVGDGQPLVEQAWFDKDSKSWKYPVEYERRPYITSMNAGYLISGVQ